MSVTSHVVQTHVHRLPTQVQKPITKLLTTVVIPGEYAINAGFYDMVKQNLPRGILNFSRRKVKQGENISLEKQALKWMNAQKNSQVGFS